MILQIGKKKQSRPVMFTPLEIKTTLNQKARFLTGFTLIELIIVASIIVVLVAVSTPRFRNTFRDLQLKDAAYNISKLIKYGQERAIIEERKYKLIFDFDKRFYLLFVETEEGAKEQSSREEESTPEDTSSSNKGWEKATGRFGGYFYLPEGINFKGDKDKIIFLPNGRCDKISLYLINKKNKIIEIKTNGRAAYVEVSEVKEEQ